MEATGSQRIKTLPELDTAVAWPGAKAAELCLEASPPDRLGGWAEVKLAAMRPRTEPRLVADEPALQPSAFSSSASHGN